MSITHIEMIQNIIYYLGLYVLVVIVNYFKLRKEYKRNPDPSVPIDKFPLKKVFWVSNEIIYAASGVYVILLDKQRDWVAPIVVVLMILIYVSTNMDSMSDRFNDNFKLSVHIIIILVFVVATITTFALKLDKSPQENSISNTKNSKDTVTYIVNVPYIDKTLIKNLGYEKCGNKCFLYRLTVKALDERAAKKSALMTFWSDSVVQPLIGRDKSNKKNALIIYEDNVFVQHKKEE